MPGEAGDAGRAQLAVGDREQLAACLFTCSHSASLSQPAPAGLGACIHPLSCLSLLGTAI